MDKKVVGILMGDASGVGPEIVAKLVVSGYFLEHVKPVFIGDVRVFRDGLRIIGQDYPHYVVDDTFQLDYSKGMPIYDLADQDPSKVVMGRLNPYCGEGDVNMVKTACRLCKEGKIAGFCYAPLHKGAMKEGGMTAESETELMAEEFGNTGTFGEINMVGDLMTVRVTSHIPLKDVSDHLTVEGIVNSIELAYKTSRSFGVKEPRIAVSGLNPHCGEGGKCGTEEITVITPAIEAAKARGWNVMGPFPPDIVFMRAFKGEFDSVVTMYHDQGQIALKVAGVDNGVTIGGGQPYPITTPAHGTAFGRAGQNRASTGSMEKAVMVLGRMVRDK